MSTPQGPQISSKKVSHRVPEYRRSTTAERSSPKEVRYYFAIKQHFHESEIVAIFSVRNILRKSLTY